MMNTIVEEFLVTPNLSAEISQDYAKCTKEATSSNFQLSRHGQLTTLHAWTIDLTALHQSYQMGSTTDVYNENALHI